MIGAKRSSDSAMLQFVFLRVKDSVAAVKIESSISGIEVVDVREDDMASTPEVVEGIALGS